MEEDLKLDLEELRHLHSIAKRPRVLYFISTEIRTLEKLSNDTVSKSNDEIPVASSQAPVSKSSDEVPVAISQPPVSTSAKVVSSPAVNYVTLESYSWDQDYEKLKIYVFLEGVDGEKIETDLKPTSVDVKFHGVQGKNYRCAIPKLNKEIVPEKCKVVVKRTKVIITLIKASKGNWLDLHFKEDKLKPNLDKGRDPMAGIVDLMKNMYEEGDDQMKKTIAKAWTNARSEQAMDSWKRGR